MFVCSFCKVLRTLACMPGMIRIQHRITMSNVIVTAIDIDTYSLHPNAYCLRQNSPLISFFWPRVSTAIWIPLQLMCRNQEMFFHRDAQNTWGICPRVPWCCCTCNFFVDFLTTVSSSGVLSAPRFHTRFLFFRAMIWFISMFQNRTLTVRSYALPSSTWAPRRY